MAARLMRRVLADFARARKNQKRGGALHRVTFDQNLLVTTDTPEDLIAIDEALRSLAAHHERKSQVVELRFFGGLSVEETAEALKDFPRDRDEGFKFAEKLVDARALPHQQPWGPTITAPVSVCVTAHMPFAR